MRFHQAPPALGNQYEDDRVLRSYLSRVLPKDVLRDVEASLAEMGRLAGGELYEFQLADRLNEPTLTQWDAWGNRVESFGGAGYVEDTGLPVLLRDSQVLPIWAGTTNMLAIDTLRALRAGDGLRQFEMAVTHCLDTVRDSHLAQAARIARTSLDHATNWLAERSVVANRCSRPVRAVSASH